MPVITKCIQGPTIEWMRGEIWPERFAVRPIVGDLVVSKRCHRNGNALAKVHETQVTFEGDNVMLIVVLGNADDKQKARENYESLDDDLIHAYVETALREELENVP
jgi:hypothetical protein